MTEQPRKGEVMKLQKLEKAWNNNVSLPSEPRRMTQMTQDIKHFIVRSMSDPIETQKLVESFQRERKQSTDALSKIFATFNFDHHDGTDQNLELRLIKVILVREGLLMSLKYCADKAKKHNSLEGNNLLELLAQLRESTLNYLEYLCLWRQSAVVQSSDQQLRAFYWEGTNYTMKIINDCDFLSDNQVIIESLNLTQEQLRCNPLMLVNNLEDFNTWMPPAERAAVDTNNQTNTTEFQSRLRLRYAERILLQEMELNNFNGSEVFVTQNHESSPTQGRQVMEVEQEQQELMVGSTALENEFDDDGGDNQDYNNMIDNNNRNNNSNERRVKTTESNSSSSNRAVGSSNLQSRASTLSNGGFSSAPSTSYGSRGGGVLRGSTDSINGGVNGGEGGYGHDFFTGHWAETPQQQGTFFNNNAAAEEEEEEQGGGEGSVVVVENGHQYPLQQTLQDDDEGSVRSLESIIRFSDIDFKILAAMPLPPKSLVLAASITVILLHKGGGGGEGGGGEEVPSDATWSAFLRLTHPSKQQQRGKGSQAAEISEEMAFLQANPQHIPRYKLIAIEPLLEQIQERGNMKNLQARQLFSQELIAVNKLLAWVKRFSRAKIEAKFTGKTKDFDRNFEGNFDGTMNEKYSKNSKRLNGGVSTSYDDEEGEGKVRSPFKSTMPITLSPIETKLRNKLLQKEKLSQTQTLTQNTQNNNKKSTQNKGDNSRSKNDEKSTSNSLNKGLKSKTVGAGNVKLMPKVNQELVVFHRVAVELSPAPGQPSIAASQQQMVTLTLLTSSDNTINTAGEDNDEEKVFALREDLIPSDNNTTPPPRLLLKVTPTDSKMSSKASQMAINMREYQLHFEDMLHKHGEGTRTFYSPSDLRWWKNNMTKFFNVFQAKNKALKMSLSKKGIDDYIHTSITAAHRIETPTGAGRRASVARGISPKNSPVLLPSVVLLPVITENSSETVPTTEAVVNNVTSAQVPKSLPKAAKKLDSALKSTRSVWKVGDYVEATNSDGFAFPGHIVVVHVAENEEREEYDVEYDDGEVLQHAKRKDITFLYSASDKTGVSAAEEEAEKGVVAATESSLYHDDFDGPTTAPTTAPTAAITAAEIKQSSSSTLPIAAAVPIIAVAGLAVTGAAIVATADIANTSDNPASTTSKNGSTAQLLSSNCPVWKVGDYVEATNSDGFAFPARIVAVHVSDGSEVEECDVEYDDGEVLYHAKKKDITFLYSSSQRHPSSDPQQQEESKDNADEEEVVYIDDTVPDPAVATGVATVAAVAEQEDEVIIDDEEETSIISAAPSAAVAVEASFIPEPSQIQESVVYEDDYSVDQPAPEQSQELVQEPSNKNVQFSEKNESLSNNNSSMLLTSTASIWKAGDFVEVNFNSGGMFYPGRIVDVHAEDDSYDIHYDDGDKQEHVHKSLINFIASASKKLSSGSIAVPAVVNESVVEAPAANAAVVEVEAADSVIIEDFAPATTEVLARDSIIEEEQQQPAANVEAIQSQESIAEEPAFLQTGAAALEEPSIASDYHRDFILVQQQPSVDVIGESIAEDSGYGEDLSASVVVTAPTVTAPAVASVVAEGSYASDFTAQQPQPASAKAAVNASDSYASDFDHHSAAAVQQQQQQASLVGTSQSYASDFHEEANPIATPREEDYSLVLDEPSPFRAVPAPRGEDESMLEVSAMTIDPVVTSNLSSPDKNLAPMTPSNNKPIAEDDDEDLYFDDDLSETVQAPPSMIEPSMSASFSLKVGTQVEPGLMTEGIIMTPLGMSSKPKQKPFSAGTIKEEVAKAQEKKQESDDNLFDDLDNEIFD